MRRKWLVSLSLLMLTFIIVACNSNDSAEGNNGEIEDQSEKNSEEGGPQAEMPEPDLENIPDVVAEVNGEKILKTEFESLYQAQFQQVMMQAQMSGQEVDQEQLKGQILDALIGQKLVTQEAENSGFEASEEAINETLDNLVKQNGFESQDDFFNALEEQNGLEKDEIMSDIETQVKVDKLIESESGDKDPTKEELQDVYDMYVAQLEQSAGENEEVDVPSFEELEPDLINHVKTEKRTETYQKLVQKLEADADISKNL